MKKQMSLSVVQKSVIFVFGICMAGGIVWATSVNVSQITSKGAGDVITANEFNTIVGTLEGIYNLDGNLGIGENVVAGVRLNVGGKITADNISADNTISAKDITATGVTKSNTIQATGSISTVNLTVSNNITASNVALTGNVTASKVSASNFYANGGFWYSSDKNLKKNIEKISNADDVLNINAVNFNWRESGNRDLGVIAQEVEMYFPELVFTNDKGMKSVDYAKLVVPLIQTMKEQNDKILQMQKDIELLKLSLK